MTAPRGRLFALSVVVSVLFCLVRPCLPADNAETQHGKKDAAKIAVPLLGKAVPVVKAENGPLIASLGLGGLAFALAAKDFIALNDWNMSISVTTWYSPADWWPYQEWIQRTCVEILRRFEEEGIEFAFPTQTIYLADDEKGRLKLELIRGEEIAA